VVVKVVSVGSSIGGMLNKSQRLLLGLFVLLLVDVIWVSSSELTKVRRTLTSYVFTYNICFSDVNNSAYCISPITCYYFHKFKWHECVVKDICYFCSVTLVPMDLFILGPQVFLLECSFVSTLHVSLRLHGLVPN
jgi:hypothetical protein